jgi:hypothetical protein
MELQLFRDSLNEEGKKYNNRFALKIRDFLPAAQFAINSVLRAGGSCVFCESDRNYISIFE